MTPQELKHAVEQMDLSQDMQERILYRSLTAGKEAPMRKKKRWKRAAVAAVAAVMVLTVTVVAASRSQVFVHWSEEGYAYASLPEAQKALEAVGGTLTLPETLSEYTFQGAYTNYEMMAETEDGRTFSLVNQSERNGLSVDYKSKSGQVTLTAKPAAVWEDANQANQTEAVEQGLPVVTEITTITGDLVVEEQTEPEATLYTLPYVYRETPTVVAIEEGMLTSEEESSVEGIEGEMMKTLQWTVDGVTYTLSQTAGDLTEQELAAMAESLMEGK